MALPVTPRRLRISVSRFKYVPVKLNKPKAELMFYRSNLKLQFVRDDGSKSISHDFVLCFMNDQALGLQPKTDFKKIRRDQRRWSDRLLRQEEVEIPLVGISGRQGGLH